MVKIKLLRTEFCPTCQKVQNIKGTTIARDEKSSKGVKKSLVVVSYYCESCNTFIRCEEQEVVDPQVMWDFHKKRFEKSR